jgi:glycosyltransferase involved in cell wall biosynthesis
MVAEAGIKVRKNKEDPSALFSIVIPTWNNLPYLQLCIDSIRKNSTYKHQIIVHINEGSDGTKEWVEQQEDIDYCLSSKNIGICFALNACRRLVTTSYFLYINDDMYTCPEWDKELYNEVKQVGHPYFFISATAIEPKAQSNCAIEKDFGKTIDTFKETELLKEFSKLSFANWQGASWPPNVVHIDTWDLVGGYSIEFSPGMYSDPDFSMKLWKAGVRYFKGVSASRVYHFGSVSVKRIKQNKGYYTFISKWAITQNTFSTYFLHKGEEFFGELDKPKLPLQTKLKIFYKRLKSITRSSFNNS